MQILKKTETKILLLLIFLSPLLGELLSGSAPPIEFFSPLGFLIIVTFYGGSTLLIREAKARWNMQWSVAFLAIAYGILEEGLMMQSFFNFNHADLGVLKFYGMFGGAMWPWTIALTVYHATVSTLIPITIIELLWPDYKEKPLLKKKGIAIACLAVITTVIFVMISIWIQQSEFTIKYIPNPILLIFTLLAIIMLILAGFYLRKTRINTNSYLISPFGFGVVGFLIQISNLFIPNILAENNVNDIFAIIIQSFLITLFICFGITQILNKKITRLHFASFVFGSLLIYIIFTPIHEFINNSTGMFAVGAIAFVLLVYWYRHIVKIKHNDKKQLST